MENHENHHKPVSNTEEYLKFSLVLLMILTIANILYYLTDSAGVADWLRWFMGSFLVIFAGFKFAGYKMFVEMFPMYDLIAKQIKAYAYAYPFIELSLGLLFMFDALPGIRPYLVIAVMGVGASGIIQAIFIDKKQIHCACLGNVIKLPLSTVSLFEDTLMIIIAAWTIAV